MTGEEDGSTMAERTYEAVKSFKERSEEIENMGDSISEGFEELAYNQRVLMEQITTGLKAHNSHDEKLDELSNDAEEVKDSVEDVSDNLEEVKGDVDEVKDDLGEVKDTTNRIEEKVSEREDRKKMYRRGVLGAGAALLGGAIYSGATGRDRIEIAEENIGEEPLEYDTEIRRDETIESFVEDLAGMEFYGEAFREVDRSLEGDEDMGLLDADGRIDFYDDEIKSSVVMSEDVYERATSNL